VKRRVKGGGVVHSPGWLETGMARSPAGGPGWRLCRSNGGVAELRMMRRLCRDPANYQTNCHCSQSLGRGTKFFIFLGGADLPLCRRHEEFYPAPPSPSPANCCLTIFGGLTRCRQCECEQTTNSPSPARRQWRRRGEMETFVNSIQQHHDLDNHNQ
jgi:hypothetical protein